MTGCDMQLEFLLLFIQLECDHLHHATTISTLTTRDLQILAETHQEHFPSSHLDPCDGGNHHHGDFLALIHISTAKVSFRTWCSTRERGGPGRLFKGGRYDVGW